MVFYLISFFLASFGIFLFICKNYIIWEPKGYKYYKYQKIKTKRANILRDGYSKKKIPENIDVIVIGSGIGGMVLAGLLSRVGKRVLVLEQHYIAGGCCHTFEEKG